VQFLRVYTNSRTFQHAYFSILKHQRKISLMSHKNHKKQQKRKPIPNTPLSQHKRSGSTVMAPLSELNIDMIDWERDLIPEHLWIAALADVFPFDSVHNQFYEFMDIIDPLHP
jgi:hypothetical protein